MRKYLIPSVLALLGLASCSIREDRGDCPAYIHLRLSERSLQIAGGLPVKLRLDDAGGAREVQLSGEDPECWQTVEKGDVSINAKLDNGARLKVARGYQSDSLWASAVDYLVLDEENEILVDLFKRFATIHVTFEEGIAPWEYDILVLGDVEGTDLTRLSPTFGEFMCRLEVEEGEATVRVPAQGENSSLRLQFTKNSAAGQPWDWDLAAELERLGYDWNARDLADISVKVSLIPAGIGVEVGSWTDGGCVD